MQNKNNTTQETTMENQTTLTTAQWEQLKARSSAAPQSFVRERRTTVRVPVQTMSELVFGSSKEGN